MSRGLGILKEPATWRREPSAEAPGEQKTTGEINTEEVVELEVGDDDLKFSFWWCHLPFRGHQQLPFAFCV